MEEKKGTKSVIVAELYERTFRLEELNGRYYLTFPKFEEMLKKKRNQKIVPYFELKKLREVIEDLTVKANEHAKEKRNIAV